MVTMAQDKVCCECGQPNGRHLSNCLTRNKESARKCFEALLKSGLRPPFVCPEQNCADCIIHEALEGLEWRDDYYRHINSGAESME
jgi:hypothetical protein